MEVMNGTYETFGFDRLSESIRKLSSLHPDEIVESLLADTRGYCGNCEFHDDVTVVVVKII